jgi:hypothetical protein
MDIESLALTVAALLQQRYGWKGGSFTVLLTTTPTGWHLELPAGYDCPLPTGTTPLRYDTTRYRHAQDALNDALAERWHQIKIEADNRPYVDDEDETTDDA